MSDSGRIGQYFRGIVITAAINILCVAFSVGVPQQVIQLFQAVRADPLPHGPERFYKSKWRVGITRPGHACGRVQRRQCGIAYWNGHCPAGACVGFPVGWPALRYVRAGHCMVVPAGQVQPSVKRTWKRLDPSKWWAIEEMTKLTSMKKRYPHMSPSRSRSSTGLE